MIRRPPRSTRTDTLFPYPTLVRSDRSALSIIYRSCAFQCRVTFRQPYKTQITARHGRLNKRKRIERVLSLREQLFMERRGFGAARFEGVHEIRAPIRISAALRSEERRVGTECVRSCENRCSTSN